jgi:hypothetical protein
MQIVASQGHGHFRHVLFACDCGRTSDQVVAEL